MEHINFAFEPLVRKDTEILICGSFPSRASREENFFYGHPRNRFWPLMARLLDSPIPTTIEEKIELVVSNKIGLTDAATSVSIKGSSDSSITNVVANDLDPLIKKSKIKLILCNGKKSFDILTEAGYDCIALPSTSPANAAYSMEMLVEYWSKYVTKNNY